MGRSPLHRNPGTEKCKRDRVIATQPLLALQDGLEPTTP